MRIIDTIEHPILRISIFEMNQKYIVKFELGALEQSFNEVGMEETIIITRSNKRANAFNHEVRNRILWYEDTLCNGDCLMVVKNNYFWLDDASKMGFIANGELFIIKRILKFESISCQ